MLLVYPFKINFLVLRISPENFYFYRISKTNNSPRVLADEFGVLLIEAKTIPFKGFNSHQTIYIIGTKLYKKSKLHNACDHSIKRLTDETLHETAFFNAFE